MLIEKAWFEHLKEEFEKPYMKKLEAFLQKEWASGAEIYPPKKDIFNALYYTPFDQTKVVIVGQDPYHNPGQAEGLSFSVAQTVKIPPSLQNIYKELKEDLGCAIPKHGSLVSWAKQGVLLLNATLTVRKNEPKSHYGKGWEEFTDAIIRTLVQHKKGVIFLLWGRSAKEKCAHITGKESFFLEAAHPSPYSSHQGFFGCRHFSKANALLEKQGLSPINWQIA